MRCPRRSEMGSNYPFQDWEDEWITKYGYTFCSYCGSIDPETFMTQVRSGEQMTPTDKNYKIYAARKQKFYFQHLNADQKIEFVSLYNNRSVVLEYPGYFYAMPYFMRET